MLTAATLRLIEETGEDILVLVELIEEAEFRRSRLTKAEVRRKLQALGDLLEALPPEVRAAMPEVDWAGWRALSPELQAGGAGGDEAAWFAARSLVPATLSWLRVYRRAEPALFAYVPLRA
jgi:hypothetical protein